MSLFGSSPTEGKASAKLAANKSSLFEDDLQDDSRETGIASSGGLFADTPANESSSADSPWSFLTPKKQARSNLVKTLLPAAEVPESYVDAFDGLLDAGERVGNNAVSVGGARRLMHGGGVDAETQESLLRIVLPGEGGAPSDGAALGRNEFNVLVALVGLTQEGEEATLDGVDERRRRLPEPALPQIAPVKPKQQSVAPGGASSSPQDVAQSQMRSSTAKTQRTQQDTLNYPDADPWASPVPTRPNQAEGFFAAAANGLSNGLKSNMPGRTTSTFTTAADGSSGTPSEGPTSGSWGGFNSSSSVNYGSSSDFTGGGFGDTGGDSSSGGDHNPPTRSIGGGTRNINHGTDETVTVVALPEKEGMFLFQYRNYEVSSSRRNSKVIRRYSDFVWLLDCLHKRYPFRQLPLLPPKRVAINGNHIAADNAFIEKRRRGLARFANTLVRHPVLSQEQLVVMFLTVPTELSVWRKQAAITVQEEFVGKTLPPHLEDSLPPSLDELFDTVRSGIRRSADTYIGLCSLLERMIKRKEGIASDYFRFSSALQTSTDASEDTYKIDTNDVPMLNEGIKSSAKHISINQSLLLDEAKAWDEGVLEDFKRHRDTLVSMRDMFDRRDRYAKDNIPQLEKRIAANEHKLLGVRNKPDYQKKPGEAEKLERAIMEDKESIVTQHARGVFIKECIRDEIRNFQSCQYHVSRMHQEWAQERVKYAELQADNWRQLTSDVDSMPVGES